MTAVFSNSNHSYILIRTLYMYADSLAFRRDGYSAENEGRVNFLVRGSKTPHLCFFNMRTNKMGSIVNPFFYGMSPSV